MSRFREEMARGADPIEATGRTMATAGRAVMLSGVTVAIGLPCSSRCRRVHPLHGHRGMLVPAFAVLTGLTLLPAVLCAPRPRVNACASTRAAGGSARARLGSARQGRDRWGAPVAAIALAAIVVLAVQAPNMGITRTSSSTRPTSRPSRRALVSAELGGAANPT